MTQNHKTKGKISSFVEEEKEMHPSLKQNWKLCHVRLNSEQKLHRKYSRVPGSNPITAGLLLLILGPVVHNRGVWKVVCKSVKRQINQFCTLFFSCIRWCFKLPLFQWGRKPFSRALFHAFHGRRGVWLVQGGQDGKKWVQIDPISPNMFSSLWLLSMCLTHQNLSRAL